VVSPGGAKEVIMLATPKLTVNRFDQFQPGDLFFCQLHFDELAGVALVAEQPSPDPKKMLLWLGPRFPRDHIAGPQLSLRLGPDAAGASFGKEFSIRLPVDAADWTRKDPAPDRPTLLVMGAKIYFRAIWDIPGIGSDFYFIDASNGLIEPIPGIPVNQNRVPREPYLFAIAWEIVTTELEPRSILKYP
jgi:hypothetical protein